MMIKTIWEDIQYEKILDSTWTKAQAEIKDQGNESEDDMSNDMLEMINEVSE